MVTIKTNFRGQEPRNPQHFGSVVATTWHVGEHALCLLPSVLVLLVPMITIFSYICVLDCASTLWCPRYLESPTLLPSGQMHYLLIQLMFQLISEQKLCYH